MSSGANYYPVHCRSSHAGAGQVFLTETRTQKTHALSALQARLFSFLYGVLPLSEHAATLLATDVSGMKPNLANSLLQSWVQSGLLQPESELSKTEPIGDDLLEETELSLRRVCFTAGRQGALRRWFASQTREHGDVPTLVFDDSRDPTVASSNRAVSGDNRYIDRAARGSWAAELACTFRNRGVKNAADILRFVLLGEYTEGGGLPSTGANRTSALLLGGADVLVCYDDDIYPAFARCRGNDSEVGVQGEVPAVLTSPMFETAFAPDMNLLTDELQPLPQYNPEQDFVRLLSQTRTESLDLADAPAEALAFLQQRNSRVHAVSLGCYGARQFAHPFRSFLSRREHDNRVMQDATLFDATQRNPHLIRHAAETTLDIGFAFSTAYCAIDARNPALPFFPIGRKQDDIYRLLYRVCFPEQLFASLPVAAFHDPQYKEPFRDEDFESYPMDIGAWTQMLIQRFARRLHHSNGPGRLREMAMSFQELGDLTAEQMRGFLAPMHHAHYQAMINHIQQELELYDDPPWWVDERRHALMVLQREQSDGPAETNEQLKEYLHIYSLWGDLLMWWPEIVKAAR